MYFIPSLPYKQAHSLLPNSNSRCLKPRVPARSQRSIPSPPSSWGPILEEETVKAPVAKFEEWPLGNAVFKRVTLNGVPTFQLQFTRDPCPKHGEGYRVTENRSSNSPAKRHRSARQKHKIHEGRGHHSKLQADSAKAEIHATG